MPDCFIIMPISTPPLVAEQHGDPDHFRHVLECLFTPAVKAAGFNPIPPAADGADIIHAQIIKQLESADLVLCDMTTLNANVFFELGIRTAVNKPVVVVKDSYTGAIPFDTTIINHYTYDARLSSWSLQEQIDQLTAHIKKCHKASKGKNPLWHYFGLHSQAHTSTTASGTESQLELLNIEVASLKAALTKIGTTKTAPVESKPADVWEVTTIDCELCRGRGYSDIGMGIRLPCPHCGGKGFKRTKQE